MPHFVVCGDNPLAYRLVRELTLRYGEQVTVIVPARGENRAPDIARLTGVRIIESPHLDDDTFRLADVPGARALALVAHGDVENLHAALRAQDLRPGLRLVLRISSVGLGPQAAELFDNCAVLSDAAIAAPALVAAALDDPTLNSLRLPDRTLQVARRFDTPPDRVLCGLADTTRPHARLLPADPADADLVLVSRPGPPDDGRPPRRWTLWGTLRLLAPKRMLVASVWVLALLLLAAVTAWSRNAHEGWFVAAYEMIMTAAGAGVTDPQHLTATQKLIQVGVTLLGLTALIPLSTALAVEIVVNARRRVSPPVPAPVHAGHVVVVGCGGTGSRVVRQLHDLGYAVVAVEANEHAVGVPAVRALGVEVIIGDVRQQETLRAARVETCRALLAITSSDSTNLEVGLLGKALRSGLRPVLRIYDGDLARRAEERFGFAKSQSVPFLAAPTFAAAMLGREVLWTIPVQRHVLLYAEELEVKVGSALAGTRVTATEAAGDVRIIALRQAEGLRWRPDGEHSVAPGERLTVVATREGLARLLAQLG